MSLFSKFFAKSKNAISGQEEALVPVPIPALAVLLVHLEKQKGAPLAEHETLEARDKAICIMLRSSVKAAMDDKRGYQDINPENVWEEWQSLRGELTRSES